MKVVGLQLALPSALLALVFSATGRADTIDPPQRGLEAKLEYCQDCHGPSGQGYHGFYAMPRLAGQQTEYIENQLRAFVERRRPHAIMSPVAHVLSPAMMTALAAKFHAFDPKPLDNAPKELAVAGEKIFQNGVPEVNVAACAACHGPQATGRGPIPRLAGQLYPYVIKALTNWSKERGQIPSGPDISAVMSPVAHSLSKAQIKAVAAYVSNLR